MKDQPLGELQNALLKMVDEVEYFIPMFTQTYDDLNQGTYSNYQKEIASNILKEIIDLKFKKRTFYLIFIIKNLCYNLKIFRN